MRLLIALLSTTAMWLASSSGPRPWQDLIQPIPRGILVTARSALAALLVVPLATACTPAESATPTASPTPTQQELSAQAEKAYRTAFDEMERMAVAGGADDVSPVIKSVAAERFLVKYRTGLQDQKRRGYTVQGAGTTRVKATPGLTSVDYDPRLTLRICEDRTKTTWTEAGVTENGTQTLGYVYGRVIDSRVMVVDIVSEEVASCDF